MSLDISVSNILLWVLLPVSLIVLVSGLGIFILWIRFSWIKRTNSADYTGADLTNKMFNKAKINPEIKNSIFYAKYWNHNKRRNTYRLRPWTYQRKSIWTMMEASQQAYATIIRQTQPKAFWLAFRLPGFIKIGGSVISIGLIIYAFTGSNQIVNGTLTVTQWFIVSIAIGILITSMLVSEIWMIWILRRDVPTYLQDSGLSEYEIKSIKLIFTWRLVYAIARAIAEILRIAIQIASRLNSNSNSSK
jgi:hypothetical protein